MSAAMSETPDIPEQSGPAYQGSPLSEDSKRTIVRMATTVMVAGAALAALAAGIAIGNAARKRLDKWAHAS
jgi:hypothetical protein